MAIYSGFTHWKWWFSIVMLVYQRVDSIDHHRSIAEPVFLGGASKNVVKLPTTITDIKILLSLVPPITTLFGKKKGFDGQGPGKNSNPWKMRRGDRVKTCKNQVLIGGKIALISKDANMKCRSCGESMKYATRLCVPDLPTASVFQDPTHMLFTRSSRVTVA